MCRLPKSATSPFRIMTDILKLDTVFLEALPVLNKLNEAGFEAYFVGGSVRDALLNKKVNDVDIATNAFPQEVKHLFKKTIDVGIEHGTVMALVGEKSYEITTFRTESTYQDFRRPDSVTFVRSLEEDLKRRDFTINALAMDSNGQISDFFNGRKDLNNGIIRAVGKPDERFNEDALRMMRAARFAAQLDFNIEPLTVKALKNNASLLSHIAIERIQVEFVKLMLGKSKSKGLAYFIQTDLYKFCPKLERSALETISEIKEPFKNERQLWAAYVLTSTIEYQQIRTFLKSWKLSNKLIQEVETIVLTVKSRMQNPVDKKTVYQVGKDLSIESERVLAYLGQKSTIQKVEECYDELPIYSKKDLAITGKDLLELTEQKGGKWLGEALDQIEEAVLSGQLTNSYPELILWVKEQNLIPGQKN